MSECEPANANDGNGPRATEKDHERRIARKTHCGTVSRSGMSGDFPGFQQEPSKSKEEQWTDQHLGTQPGDIQEQAELPSSGGLGVPVQNTDDSDQPSTSQVSSKEEHAATQVFSSSDQGPLTDQSTFIPNDSLSTPRSVSPTEPGPAAPDKGIDNAVSLDGTAPLASPTDAIPTQDRWVQIRKNAAERVKVAPKASDKYTRDDARGSIDDGETSGEESIESRVARIKARVAELTGYMDTTTRV